MRHAPTYLTLLGALLLGCPGADTLDVSTPGADLGADLGADMSSPPDLDAPDLPVDPPDEEPDTAVALDAAPDLDAPDLADPVDTPPDMPPITPCPAQMALVGEVCMDLYEAPGVAGERPLVMYTLLEAESWCEARGKRLCFDDEWRSACEGAAMTAYPYGAAHQPGVCRDEARWRAYTQSTLNGWPAGVSSPQIESLDALLAEARTRGAAATAAADHIEALYQGVGSGTYAACTNETGVMDLTGNVEEWTRRRDGGQPSFHGTLKGRYWAETRTCQSAITTHGDTFRFYEIGFRCCQLRR
jgi:hypothetical protein